MDAAERRARVGRSREDPQTRTRFSTFHRTPPALVDDVIGEILLRVPPQDPACLIRASLVCKSWRRLLSHGAFLRQYRTFHRSPPTLGFFQDHPRKGTLLPVPQFVPTIQASPVLQPAVAGVVPTSSACLTVDCRHGRALFQITTTTEGDQLSETLVVWDPITGHMCVSPPVHHPYAEWTAAVLCATDGCDHLECSSGGPFLVVIAGVYHTEELEEEEADGNGDSDGVYGYVAWARIYSSETGVWTASTSVTIDSCFDAILPSFVAGDAVYFILDNGNRILEYGLVGGVLSVIDAPPQHQPNMIFAAVQDGELGAATVEGYSLHLWSRRVTDDPNHGGGGGQWVRCRVIELDVMIPMSIGAPWTAFDLAGFAEGAGSIFISANDELFTVQLKSGQITKMGKRTSDEPIFPFTSFYTPDRVTTVRLEGPMRTG